MYCGNCGRYNNKNSQFCEGCGRSLNNIPNAVNTNNNIQNNIPRKKPRKKHGCLIAFLIFFTVIITLIGLLFFLTRPKEDAVDYEFVKEFKYLAVLDSGEYIINNAPQDLIFYVTSDANYEIVDEEGNKVDVILKGNKIINPSKYKKGEKYTIVLTSGKFVSTQLENANKVTFKIERDEVKKHKYKENVIEVKNLNLNSDKTSFTSTKKYNVGEVLIVGSKEKLSEAYIVESSVNNTYSVRPAQLNEIYSELNYYYEDYVDLSNYEVSSQIKEYLVSNIESSNWYNAIAEIVHAKPEFEIDFKSIKNGIEASVLLKVKAGDNSLLLNSKYHDIEIEFKQRFIVSQLIDITLFNWDVQLDITSSQAFGFKLKNEIIDYKNATTKKVNKELIEKIKNAIKNSEYKDENEKSAEILSILIPTPVPCLSIEFELELLNEIAVSAEFSFEAEQTTNVVFGFDYGVGEKLDFIGDYNKELPEVSVSFVGTVEEKFGIELSVGLNIINVVAAKADVAAGLYAEANLGITASSSNENIFEMKANVEGGIFLDFGVSAEIAFAEFKHKFVNKKWPLFSKEWTSTTEEAIEEENLTEENNDDSKPTYKYEERLEQFSCVSSLEEDSYTKLKFDYDNGELENVTLTGAYFANTGYEWLDNIIELICRFITLLMRFKYDAPATYYEEDNYVYIVVKLDKENYRKYLNELSNVTDENYNSFKVTLQQQGYTCK